MRSPPGLFRLSFMLPAGIAVDSGRGLHSESGCTLNVAKGLVEILGPSRESVFEVAATFLRVIQRAKPSVSIAATLESPLPLSGRDGWHIIINAPIAFSPTSLDPYFPASFTR